MGLLLCKELGSQDPALEAQCKQREQSWPVCSLWSLFSCWVTFHNPGCQAVTWDKEVLVPISRALGNKISQGPDSNSQKKHRNTTQFGVEFENNKAKRNPHGWPQAHMLNIQNKVGTSSREPGRLAPHPGGGQQRLHPMAPNLVWVRGSLEKLVEARWPPPQEEEGAHTPLTLYWPASWDLNPPPLAYLII